MSINFKTPNRINTKERFDKILSSQLKSKSNPKLSTIESKIIETKKVVNTKLTANRLLTRINERNQAIRALQAENKDLTDSLSYLTLKMKELIQLNPKVGRHSSLGTKSLLIELSRIIEIKKKNLIIARNNNKLMKNEYEEFTVKSSMKNKLDSLKAKLENARNKKYNLIWVIKNHKNNGNDDLTNIDGLRSNESNNTNSHSLSSEKARSNYIRKTSESRDSIRESIYKISGIKQVINNYKLKDNDNDYNKLIEAIKQLFIEINKELNDTPDEIINKIELKNDNQEVSSNEINELQYEKAHNKFVHVSKSLVNLKIENKLKGKQSQKRNKKLKNKRKTFKHDHFTNIIDKASENACMSHYANLITNVTSSDCEEALELIKEKNDLIMINDSLINQIKDISKEFLIKEQELENQIEENNIKLHNLINHNNQLKKEIEEKEN